MTLKKNQVMIDVPLENVNLSKYVIGYQGDTFIYELYGVCNHMGNVLGGHYTATVKTKKGWYHFNDRNVTKVNEHSSIISPMAYCLFFRKKK